MYIQLVQVQLRSGVDEQTLVQGSERFQEAFVNKQPGIVKRVLMRGEGGVYADLVFFASKADADRVAQTEATNPHCAEFFKLVQPAGETILSFEEVKSYG
jgi:hypothetical protein